MKTLYVTDFDDTLVKTDANVYVTTADGNSVTMSPEEYAVYDIQPGDTFDFSEFENLKNPKPIARFTALLKRVVDEKKADKVAVLTARGHTKPISKFLQSIGIDSGISIAALGDSNPQRKANYIEKHIKDGYTKVAFIDDSPKNIASVDALKKKYPEARIVTHQVKEPEHTDDTDGKSDTGKNSTDKKVSGAAHVSGPSAKQGTIEKLMRSKIKNPDTDNDILVKTALKYDKDHPVYKQAMAMVARMARQKNPDK